MKNITLHIKPGRKNKACPIIVGVGIMQSIALHVDLNEYSNIFVITDTTAGRLFLKTMLSQLPKASSFIVLPSGEKEKNNANVQRILRAMQKAQCDRHSLIITVGGGVISDIGGFAASIYMRGVDVLNIPTTLLSQVDAAIGGKTGINAFGIKNLIGTFHQPICVLVDVAALSTLPKREFISGFMEIIKHGLIADHDFFNLVMSKHPSHFTESELTDIIARSVEIKTDIVSRDETEQSTRKLLNFGHTAGHAIEALSLNTKNPILHGEAIALGMIIETNISHLLGMLSKSDSQHIVEQLLPLVDIKTISHISADSIIKKIQSDKKKQRQDILWTLLKNIGHAVVDKKVANDIVIQAFHQTQEAHI